MLFQSLVFLLFFVPVFVGNLVCTNVLRSAVARKWLLVSASAVFYMSWNVPLYAPLVTSALVNFLAARRVAGGVSSPRR